MNFIDDQMWPKVEAELPPKPRHPTGGGRARCLDRRIFEALCFLYAFELKPSDLPWTSFSDVKVATMHRRYVEWIKAGVPAGLKMRVGFGPHRWEPLANVFALGWGKMDHTGSRQASRRRRHGGINAYRTPNKLWQQVTPVVPPICIDRFTERDIIDTITTRLHTRDNWHALEEAGFPGRVIVAAALRRWRRNGTLSKLAQVRIKGIRDRHSKVKWWRLFRDWENLPPELLAAKN